MSVRFVDSRLDFGEAELLVRKGIEENSVVFEKGQRTVTLKLKDGFNERICAAALRRLAISLLTGYGIKKDITSGTNMLKKAAERGDREAEKLLIQWSN